MKHKHSFALTGLVIATLTLCPRTYAADSDKDKLVPYKQVKTISIPDGLVGFDIMWIPRAGDITWPIAATRRQPHQ